MQRLPIPTQTKWSTTMNDDEKAKAELNKKAWAETDPMAPPYHAYRDSPINSRPKPEYKPRADMGLHGQPYGYGRRHPLNRK
jgi:hypothetical protein